MRNKTTIIKNCKKSSFLIGDSERYGKDQVISGEIKYNKKGLFDAQNEKTISKAKEIAGKEGFFNIRIVTCFFDAIAIYCGIIGYKKTKETVISFNF